MKHITVLTKEAVVALELTSDSVVVDCTLGAGGHAKEILKHLGQGGVYIGIDADSTAVEAARPLLKDSEASVHLVNGNFKDLKQILQDLGLVPDAILADLGWRSDQFEDGQKGFSFQKDEPLLMTYGNPEDYLFTAYDIVNEWEEESIADVIYGYGEERYSRRIAKAILNARSHSPIKTSGELAKIVTDAVPFFYRRGKTNPATKTFQALRIAVNDELGVLKSLLKDGFDSLNPGGRFAIISFHSLEDRLVKNYFNHLNSEGVGEKVTKKPITASEGELDQNPRARSAKLRIIKKLNSSSNE